MVTNSIGKRNFMWPMGRPKHALKVPCFFFLLILGGGGLFSNFPWFSMCSHYVPFKFPSSSQHVPFKFPSSSQHVPFKFPSSSQHVPRVLNVFPNMFSIAL